MTITETNTTNGAKTKRDYKLISADGHLMGPGDLFTSRVAEKYRDRVPRIERLEEYDAWVIPGHPPRGSFGWGACAGNAPNEMFSEVRFEDIRPGNYDPKARCAELDIDNVDAEVLFPNGPDLVMVHEQDPEFHIAMVRAYNDHLSEFCSYAPDRLGGAALLPNRGVEQAVAEVERCMEMPGFVSWLLKCYPHGDVNISPEDDPLWAAIEESGRPISIHVSLSDKPLGQLKATTLPGTVHFYDAPARMLEIIFAGVLDRFPKLQFVMTEVDCGWVPYFEEQADDNYLRHSKSSLRDVKLSKKPSEYMHDHFPVCFVNDHYGIENRHRIGVDRMLWSSDYPHIVSDWPYSWKTINAAFAGVPADERHQILAGNAQRIFKFGQ
jgi:predicted TIM-barrel fold metal-dependent hydrolase